MNPKKDILKLAKEIKLKKPRVSSLDTYADAHDLGRLGLAWIRGELTMTQVIKTLGRDPKTASGSTMYAICSRLRAEVVAGRLKLE